MSKAMDKLFESELFDWQRERIDIENPQFKKAGRIHDWRNHVPYEVKEVWNELSAEERKVFALMAGEAADMEEWD